MMKIQQEFSRGKKSMYDDVFHDTIFELENIRLMFSSFNPLVPFLSKQHMTANSFIEEALSFVIKLNAKLFSFF